MFEIEVGEKFSRKLSRMKIERKAAEKVGPGLNLQLSLSHNSIRNIER